MDLQRHELRDMNDFLIRAITHTRSVLQSMDKALSNSQFHSESVIIYPVFMKDDFATAIAKLYELEQKLGELVDDPSDLYRLPGIAAYHQAMVNICLDCYITTLQKTRKLIDEKIAMSIPLPILDEELKLAEKVRKHLYKP